MKANEAPEKIYKTTTYLDERKSGVVKWKDKPVAGAENIEYTRTDAFIDKACLYLFENYHGEKLSLRMIENFRKYLKGE